MPTISEGIATANELHIVDNEANPYIHALTGAVRVLMARAGIKSFTISEKEWAQAHDNDEDLSCTRTRDTMEFRLDKYSEIEAALNKVIGENDAGLKQFY